MRRAWWALGLLACLRAGASMAQSPTTINVGVEGSVNHSGPAVYPSDARLSTVALAAGVDPLAYMLGAAWLQPTLQRDQLRLRAGLLYELGAIHGQAMVAGNLPLAKNSGALRALLSQLPVTGRRPGVNLDPDRLEVTPADDWPVHDGDRLSYPRRPTGVRVVGAVDHDCTLPHVPMQDARRYLAACPASGAAEQDLVYVVQPDGSVFAQNIALWNRDAPRPLAPGAWIYVPLKRSAIAGAADDSFNRDVADFLATQPWDDAGWQ